MRIISGKFRGKRLHPPSHLPVRPTTDFAREGLFNVLNNIVDFEELHVLDLFAGTGCISYEFLSRGCREVVAVDIHPKCMAFIEKSGGMLGVDNLITVRLNVFTFLKRYKGAFDLIFADPPYDMAGIEHLPGLILTNGFVRPGGIIVMEHPRRIDFSTVPEFDQHRKYGNVNFSFFRG